MINVCVTVNSKYMRYLYVMLESLYANNKKSNIKLWVINRDFTEEDKQCIDGITDKFGNQVEYIWVDEKDYEGITIHPSIGSGHWSLEIYFRLRIPEYIPSDIDRILLLDVDLAILGDISELYDIELDGKLFAAAPNMCDNCRILDEAKAWYPKNRKNQIHYNTGILLWNLKEIRKRFSSDHLFNLIWDYKFGVPTFEEELINVVFGENEILTIPCEKWNYIPLYTDIYKEPRFSPYESNDEIKRRCKIVHYAGRNPWHIGPKNEVYEIWWEICKNTPFYNEILLEGYVNAEKKLRDTSESAEYKLRLVDYLIDKNGSEEFVLKVKEKGWKSVLIYGASRIGRCIKNALEKSEIGIVAFIDKDKNGVFYDIPIIGLEEVCRYSVDGIIISNSFYEEEIRNDMGKYTSVELCTIEGLTNKDFDGRI